jgi:hypothetical protein
MTLKEVPTNGCISDKVYYEHASSAKEYRFVIRFQMTEEEAVKFIDDMIDKGAIRIRAEAEGKIIFIETPMILKE